MAKLIRVLEWPSLAAGLVGGWLLVLLTIVVCYEVVARYAFNAPTLWGYELGTMLTGSAFLIGLAYALRQDGHIRIDFVTNAIGPRGKAVVDLLGYVLLMLPLTLWLCWFLLRQAIASYASQEHTGASAWNPVIWPIRTVFFAAFLLLLLQIAAEIIKALRLVVGREGPR